MATIPERMPTSLELRGAFGGRGVSGQAANVFRQLRDEEQRGRKLRESQVQDNCSFQWSQVATFDAEALEKGMIVTDWIQFGTLRFTTKPVFLTGSEWLTQGGEPPMDPERNDLDPAVNAVIPGGAMVVAYKTDERGLYQAAKLVLYAYGSVPSGYRVNINGLWVGPAVRKA